MKQQELADGVVMRYLNHSDALTVSRIEFEAGASAVLHEHPHEEVDYALEGRFEVQMAGGRYVLTKGQSVRIPANTLHGIRNLAGEAALLCVWPGPDTKAPSAARSEPKARARA